MFTFHRKYKLLISKCIRLFFHFVHLQENSHEVISYSIKRQGKEIKSGSSVMVNGLELGAKEMNSILKEIGKIFQMAL